MLPDVLARRLSNQQKRCLTDHVCGPQEFHTVTDTSSNGLRATKRSLIDLKLLSPTGTPLNPRPSELKLTDMGREVVCIILGEYADKLVEAGVLDPLTGQQVLLAIEGASQRKRPICEANLTPSPVVAIHQVTHANSIAQIKNATDQLLSRLQRGS